METVPSCNGTGIAARAYHNTYSGQCMVVQAVYAGLYDDRRRPRQSDGSGKPEYLWYGVQ